jgi:hypothetical protein
LQKKGKGKEIQNLCNVFFSRPQKKGEERREGSGVRQWVEAKRSERRDWVMKGKRERGTKNRRKDVSESKCNCEGDIYKKHKCGLG